MDTISPFHWLVVIAILSLLIPTHQIIRRAGYSGWWCVLVFVPIVNLVALWVFAFVRWPAIPKPNSK